MNKLGLCLKTFRLRKNEIELRSFNWNNKKRK